MIIGNKYLKNIFKNGDENQYQPNSFDLKLNKVYIISRTYDKVGIIKGEKHLPNLVEISTNYNGDYLLEPLNTYIVEIEDDIEIPNDVAQFYLIRSTLLRCGITTCTALGDSGFKGHLMFLLKNESLNNVYITKGERIATAVNFEVAGASLYDGDYNECNE